MHFIFMKGIGMGVCCTNLEHETDAHSWQRLSDN
jgi:hypothetical protein